MSNLIIFFASHSTARYGLMLIIAALVQAFLGIDLTKNVNDLINLEAVNVDGV